MNIRKISSVVLIVLGATAPVRADDAPNVERNGPICDSLPRELLEQSYADREVIFEHGIAEKYGWRAHDAEFEAATGLSEEGYWQKDGPRVALLYDKIVYQRTDVDANDKDELVVFGTHSQGRGILSGLNLLCDYDNWRISTCDNIYQGSVGRWRTVNLEGEARGPRLQLFATELDERKIGGDEGQSQYIYGAVFLPAVPVEVAQNGPLDPEFLILSQPVLALTSLYYDHPERPENSDTVYGAELLGVRPNGFSQLAFCTWSR